MKTLTPPCFKLSLIAAAVSLCSVQALAQDEGGEGELSFGQDGQAENFETVFITGSHIKSDTEDSAAPIQIFDRNMFEVSGSASIADYVKNIPMNTGSEFQLDSFTQNTSQGTASVNLRGLGLGSTLVLFNGKRPTLSAAFSNDGSSFVDINTLPAIALERVEILKEGAGAIYGSDAVAGVMNFITRHDFEGLRVDLGYQTTTDGDQDENDIGFLWGSETDVGHMTFALNYKHRNPLAAVDRDFTQSAELSAAGQGLSAVGSPGAMVYLAGAPLPIIDPACGPAGGIPNGLGFGVPGVGVCQFDFKPYYQLITEEEHLQSMFTYRTDVTDSLSVYADALFSTSDIDQLETSPSLPIVDFPGVPNANPGIQWLETNVLIPNGLGALVGQPGIYAGRPLGNGVAADDNGKRNGETLHLVTGAEGDISDLWSFDTSIAYSRNEYAMENRDTRTSRFQAALAGLGGPNCNGVVGDPSCTYWNPIGPGLSPVGGGDNANLLNWVLDIASVDRTSELLTMDFVATGEVAEVAAGSISTAAGIQYRRESLEMDVSEGYALQDYSALIGADAFHEQREVFALFNEWDIPLLDTLDMTAAVRYESYHGTNVGSSVDPKVALRWQATERWVVRGSASTSFRAPSIHQQAGGSVVNLEEIFDPAALGGLTGGLKSFTPIIPSGNPDLDPESSRALNVGFLYVPNDTVSFSMDYWRFDIDDIIIRENAQAVAVNDASLIGPGCTGGDPAVTRSVLCTITGVNVTYINSGEVVTDGIDLTADFEWDLSDMGSIRTTLDMTWVNQYELTDGSVPNAPTIDAVGKRNYTNFARSMPELRANLAAMWVYESHRASAIIRYTHGYENDQFESPAPGTVAIVYDDIDSWTTLDLQYGYLMEFDNDSSLDLSVGLVNATDEEPPEVEATLGYDTKIADPRGRMAYLRASYRY